VHGRRYERVHSSIVLLFVGDEFRLICCSSVMPNALTSTVQSVHRIASHASFLHVERNNVTQKSSSLMSVDRHRVSSKSRLIRYDSDLNQQITRQTSTINTSTTAREHVCCSITDMLLVYASKAVEMHAVDHLERVLDVLQRYFHTYANRKQEIYFEGLFQILHDFNEHIPECILIETMERLDVSQHRLFDCSTVRSIRSMFIRR
jgi:hypothetical protein